jgi:hypothetical protein
VDVDKLTILLDNEMISELLDVDKLLIEIDNDIIFNSVFDLAIDSVKINLENVVDNDVEIINISEEVDVDKDVS